MPLTPYTLRLATPADIQHLPAVELAASALFAEAGVHGTVSVMPTEELEQARQEGLLLVGVDPDDLPIGFAMLKISDDSLHIAEMDVHPVHGRRGVGSALLEACIEQARQREFRAVTLTTYETVPWNGPFYAGRGFAVVPSAEWTPTMAAIASAEGVVSGSGRVLMRRVLAD